MTETNAAPKTPWHLWVVGGVSLAWNSFGVYDFVRTTTQGEAYWKESGMTKPMIDYYHAMPAWMFGPWVLGVFGAFAGSIFLLLRKGRAVDAFAVSLLGAFSSLVYGLLNPMPEPPPALKAMRYMSYFIVVIAGLLFRYAVAQRKRGVLG